MKSEVCASQRLAERFVRSFAWHGKLFSEKVLSFGAVRKKGDVAREARALVRFATNVNSDIAEAAGLVVMRVDVIDYDWGK